MPLPRFDFELHEWPPLAVGEREGLADAVFKVLWNDEEVEVMTRRVDTQSPKRAHIDRRLFFKCFGEKHARTVSLSDKRPRLFGEFTEEDDETLVGRAIRFGMWGYAIRLDTTPWNVPGVSWLYLDADKKTGCWTAFNGVFKPTHFRVEPNFSRLVVALNDEHSDARFALAWSQLSGEEKQDLSVCFSQGDKNELLALVRALSFFVQLPGAQALSFGRNGFGIEKRFAQQDSPDARLRRWAFHMNRYFAPFLNPALAEHQCVRFLFRRVNVPLPCSPTHHERLEAALFLREWARGKIPPDELRLLLPKL